MTIREALKAARSRLEAADVPESGYDAGAMLAHLLGEDRLRMLLDDAREVEPQKLAQYETMILRRAQREPMQYILGEAEFMGLSFHVEPGVLIPRFDTETVCEKAVEILGESTGRVLDIGTGPGTLAVSIAKRCAHAAVTAVDISDTALAVARDNARRLGAPVRFLKSDCFSVCRAERFDLIVSNPPYISDEEMKELMPEVQKEPELALYGGADGLDFYRRIAQEAPMHLAKGGCLLFEIGWKQKGAVSQLLREHIGKPYALRDLGGNWRAVYAFKEE